MKVSWIEDDDVAKRGSQLIVGYLASMAAPISFCMPLFITSEASPGDGNLSARRAMEIKEDRIGLSRIEDREGSRNRYGFGL